MLWMSIFNSFSFRSELCQIETISWHAETLEIQCLKEAHLSTDVKRGVGLCLNGPRKIALPPFVTSFYFKEIAEHYIDMALPILAWVKRLITVVSNSISKFLFVTQWRWITLFPIQLQPVDFALQCHWIFFLALQIKNLVMLWTKWNFMADYIARRVHLN